MSVVMIHPNPSSEKGISAYSLQLIENIRKQGTTIRGLSFLQGKPLSLISKISTLRNTEVIHLQHEYNMLGFYGLPYFLTIFLLGLIKKKSLIVTMHSVLSQNEEFQSGRIKTFLRKVLYNLQNRWINLFADSIIVHSHSSKRILQAEYGVPEKKVTVFPHAIIENVKTVSKEKAKKELKLKGPVYLLIGTMVPDHGHDLVLQQADKIGKTILVATNPSPINNKNQSRIKNFLKLNQDIVKDKGFEKFVRFDVGPIPYEKWWRYFAAADLILLPYRVQFGSGIFADAMAVKKPVVASNVRYFKEFAENYGCLVTAKNNQDYARVIKESMKPQNYKKMLKECERYFKENGLTPISKKYAKLYTTLSQN